MTVRFLIHENNSIINIEDISSVEKKITYSKKYTLVFTLKTGKSSVWEFKTQQEMDDAWTLVSNKLSLYDPSPNITFPTALSSPKFGYWGLTER